LPLKKKGTEKTGQTLVMIARQTSAAQASPTPAPVSSATSQVIAIAGR
jgi:hypothetical protein